MLWINHLIMVSTYSTCIGYFIICLEHLVKIGGNLLDLSCPSSLDI